MTPNPKYSIPAIYTLASIAMIFIIFNIPLDSNSNTHISNDPFPLTAIKAVGSALNDLFIKLTWILTYFAITIATQLILSFIAKQKEIRIGLRISAIAMASLIFVFYIMLKLGIIA